MGFSMSWGITALLAGAAPFYLAAAFALPGPPGFPGHRREREDERSKREAGTQV